MPFNVVNKYLSSKVKELIKKIQKDFLIFFFCLKSK